MFAKPSNNISNIIINFDIIFTVIIIVFNIILNFTTIFFSFLHSTISLILKRLVTTSYVSRHSKLYINLE